MIKNTKKNREKLSSEIVNQMDMDNMIEALQEQHETFYTMFSDEDFDREWKEVFGEG